MKVVLNMTKNIEITTGYTEFDICFHGYSLYQNEFNRYPATTGVKTAFRV